jgi:polysaccharide pyruvyl transferase WcaK-like protein
MDACIGIRFHSLVLATSMGVPTMTLAYAHKNHSIMDQLGLGEFSIDLAGVDTDAAVAMLESLMDDRTRVRGVLEASNEAVHAQYDSALEELARVIG